jgi:tetratricopeptide (TPR) repeat protein
MHQQKHPLSGCRAAGRVTQEAIMSTVGPLSFLCSRGRWRRLASCVAVAAACILPVPASADMAHDEALQALASSDASQRRQAVQALGDSGSMQDADLLLDALRDADPEVRALAEQSVWRVWTRSDDPDVNALMQAGMRNMQEGKLGLAVDAFTRVIEKQPDFAEGWNKRATVYFLIGDYDQSLKDCDETLQRNPNHFGALAGCGAIYAQREELDRALEYFERALEVNPNLEGIEVGLALVRQRLGARGRQSI